MLHALYVSGNRSFSNVQGFTAYLWLSNAHRCMFSLRHYFLFCSPSMPNNNDGKDLAHRLDKQHTHCQLPPPAPFVCLLCSHYHHWQASCLFRHLNFAFLSVILSHCLSCLSYTKTSSLNVPSVAAPSLITLLSIMPLCMLFSICISIKRAVAAAKLCIHTTA